MESQPQNPEFRNNPENFHPCFTNYTVNEFLWGLLHVFKLTHQEQSCEQEMYRNV